MMNPKTLISFDYAIKYLLKDKGDYDIVEGFISALLKTKGYGRVKIIALLESESNKEDPKDKRSIADLIVEDEDKKKYIIEIERNVKDTFVHKACFNTSRLIIDNLAQREDYTQIIKVFHISLLYFPIGHHTGAIYHGKTVIHEIESNERLHIHLRNAETNEEFDATEILPEYFFISVPQFNDRLKDEIDEWLYVLKHDAVPETFQSSYMKKVADKLALIKMSEADRADYTAYMKKVYSDRDELEAALERGRFEGIEEGKAEGIAIGLEEGKAEERRTLFLKKKAKGKTDIQIMDEMEISFEELTTLKKHLT